MTEPAKFEKRYIDFFIKSLSIKNSHSFYRTIERKKILFAELYVYSLLFFEHSNSILLSDKEKIKKNLDIILSNKWSLNNVKDMQDMISFYQILYKSTTNIRNFLSNEELKRYEILSSTIIRKMKIEQLLNEK